MLNVLNVHTHTHKRDTRKHLEVMDVFITLIVVVVSWVDACVQTHQIIHIKRVQLCCMPIILQ